MKQTSVGAGLGETAVRDILERGRNPRWDTVQKLCSFLGIDPGDLGLSTGRLPEDPISLTQVKRLRMERGRLPVYAAVEAGDGGIAITYDAIEWIDLPPVLAGVAGAFGLYCTGSSMEPMLKQGDMVYVHPTRPPKPGDIVVCILKKSGPDGEFMGYVKRLKGSTSTHHILQQLSPPQEIKFAKADVKLHRVVGVEYA